MVHNATAGPSRIGPRRRDTGPSQDSEEERGGDSGPENAQTRPLSFASHNSGSANGGNGQHPDPLSPTSSVRRPPRAVSYSQQTIRPERPQYAQMPTPRTPMPAPPPGAVEGSGMPADLNREGLASHRSGLDYIVPFTGRDRRSMHSQNPTLAGSSHEPKTIYDRLRKTIEAAERERNAANIRGS